MTKSPSPIHFIIVLFGAFLTGCSAFSAPKDSQDLPPISTPSSNAPSQDIPETKEYFEEDAYSLSPELASKGTPYSDVVKMEAASDWETALSEGFSFQVPYSEEWTIDGKPVLQTNLLKENEETFQVSFGKYVNQGTYFAREYLLSVRPLNADSKMPQSPEKNECPESNSKRLSAPPQKATVGPLAGVSSLVGGAKGCATAFDFTFAGHSMRLMKLSPMGSYDYEHQITKDMVRILEGIKVKD